MLKFVTISLISLSFISSAIGKSKSYEHCYDFDAVELCDERYEQHKILLGNLELHDKVGLRNFKKSCKYVINCLSSIADCDMFGDPKIEPLVELVKVNCDLVEFFDDSPCYIQLRNNRTKCFKTWNAHITDEQNSSGFTRKIACRNYFGNDACMEKEVTEICGKKEWASFRDLYTTLVSDVWHECDKVDVITGLVATLTERKEGWKIKYGQ